jgi:hypothetical protein
MKDELKGECRKLQEEEIDTWFHSCLTTNCPD